MCVRHKKHQPTSESPLVAVAPMDEECREPKRRVQKLRPCRQPQNSWRGALTRLGPLTQSRDPTEGTRWDRPRAGYRDSYVM